MAGYAAGVNESVLWQGIIFASVSRTRARGEHAALLTKNTKHVMLGGA